MMGSTRMDTGLTDRSIVVALGAPGAEWRSGLGSEVIGTFFLLPGGGVGFLGLRLSNHASALVADAGPEKRWSRPVSVDRLTDLPVLRPSVTRRGRSAGDGAAPGQPA